MTRREADIFAAVVDAVVDPEPPLPPVGDTDAVAAFERWLAAAPPFNRVALRALLYAVERVTGERARLRALPRPARLRALERWGGAGEALRSTAAGCYWGDAGALRAIGAVLWEASRARDGRDWMLNSGVLKLRNPGPRTHVAATALFAAYPLCLWLGYKHGRR